MPEIIVHHADSETLAKVNRAAVVARRWFDRLFVQATWAVGLAPGSIQALLEPGSIPNLRYVSGSSANYRYLADPFPLASADDGSLALLCEEFDLWRENRGTLKHVEIKDGAVYSSTPAIELTCHASFPFLIRHGDLFCVPETGENRKIEMFRCAKFPDAWEKHATLVEDFAAADPTIFQFENRWWLAATSRDIDEYRDLFLWYADALTGPWRAHLANPVKSDVRSARPAGTPFVHAGRLYRPAQDCSDGYGRRVTINRIDILTRERFQETPVTVIEPDPHGPFPDGLHTVNFIDGLIVIDGRRDFFDPFKQVKKQIIARVVRSIRSLLRRA